jgi:hypothetical protein
MGNCFRILIWEFYFMNSTKGLLNEYLFLDIGFCRFRFSGFSRVTIDKNFMYDFRA